MEKYICAILISFYIYGFAGWIWESFVCPILTGHKLKNSGFLNGPIVPIYGVGAITVSLLFSADESHLSVFIEGAFVACLIEYITSWGMEKLYHQRWWDYSSKAFNVNGRVCLEGFLVFGLFSVVCVKYVQPYLLEKILEYGLITLVVIVTALSTVFILDFIFTVTALMHLEERLDEMMKAIETYSERMLDEFEERQRDFSMIKETKDFSKIMEYFDKNDYKKVFEHAKFPERRIVRAFPQLMNRKKDSNNEAE